MTRTVSRLIATAAAVGLCAVAVGACGSSSKSSSSGSSVPAQTSTAGSSASGVVAALASKVPAAVRSKGTLTVGADATYPPNEFIGSDGKTVEGMDADLAKALAGVLGLKADVKNATFDSIIPGLAAHKYDLGMSSFTDTREREKTVDFVTYFSAGTSFYVKAQGGLTVNTLADLCGKTVAVEKGTTQQADAEGQSKKCSGGKVTVLTFPDQNGANLALSSGRAQVGMADSPVADYQVKKSSGQFKLVGRPYGTAPYGIAMAKDSGMAPVVKAALQDLIKNGAYMNVLAKWGITSGAIKTPVINGAIS
ncbi:MAG TPA: ABC transporter substrate-binding protein [Baekduia sp.]|uniref:ABC transporter substrate-binding protein n=1 Tax=Baekduia sp. TaxID=2600305 RepID=UPI002BD45038|nr:ABC transporter substrate-binding protein [Baekduia sp.]HMJ34516.1 ABC transporter substrate-binding protein [Baekduia sp.]